MTSEIRDIYGQLIDGMQDAIGNPELARKIFIENAETLFFGR